MFILTISGQQTEGAYAVTDPDGERALYLFEEEDDAERYIDQLKAKDHGGELQATEVEHDLVLHTCIHHGYKYSIITKNDLIIPSL